MKKKTLALFAIAYLTIFVLLQTQASQLANPNFYSLNESITSSADFGKPNVQLQIVRNDEVVFVAITHNIVTNAGMNWSQYKEYNNTGATGTAYFIAVSNDNAAPAYTDTTLAGEQSSDGLTRQAGTMTAGTPSSGDVTTYIHYNYTYTGSGITIYKAGLFTESSGGVLYAAALFASSATLEANDELNVQWTITKSN